MAILGISSATKIVSIGLVDGEKLLLETTIASARAEKITAYLAEAGVLPEQLTGIAVAIGPGSYSGLRGGVTTAKTLAQSLSVPLAAVPTLDAVAYNLRAVEGTVAVLLDARHDEYNFALFACRRGESERLTEDLILPYDRILEQLNRVSGRLWLAGKTALFRKELKGENFVFAGEGESEPFGVNVAWLGASKIAAGQIADPLQLLPVYSHQPIYKEFKQAQGVER